MKRKIRNSLTYLIFLILFVVGTLLLYRGSQVIVSLEAQKVGLEELPAALSLSFIRMCASYLASLVFSYFLGILAARTRLGERLIIPIIDILQSIPIVGFFPAALAFFINITQGHRIGIEFAACFLIFTSMVWNLTFSIYETVRGIPNDLHDPLESFGLKGSQRFWRLYLPATLPRVVFNSVLSWANGWFFLVACEIISVGSLRYHLPGIGSFLAIASENDSINLVLWGLLCLTVVILFMDFVLWRPLTEWSTRFRLEAPHELRHDLYSYLPIPSPVRKWIRPLRRPFRILVGNLLSPLRFLLKELITPLFWDLPKTIFLFSQEKIRKIPVISQFETHLPKGVLILSGFILVFLGYHLRILLSPPWPDEIYQIPLALLQSTGRVIIALLFSMIWIFPLVYWVWDKPKIRNWIGTFAQIGAGLPAIALFPLLILLIVNRMGGGMETASILLLMTGMQWYLLFNFLAGVSLIPSETLEVSRSFGLSRRELWNRVVLPGIRPTVITGIITGWGGGWNALVVAEYLSYKGDVLSVKGIGSLLNRAVFEMGDPKLIAIVLSTIVVWILIINIFFWQRIYSTSIDRCRFEG